MEFNWSDKRQGCSDTAGTFLGWSLITGNISLWNGRITWQSAVSDLLTVKVFYLFCLVTISTGYRCDYRIRPPPRCCEPPPMAVFIKPNAIHFSKEENERAAAAAAQQPASGSRRVADGSIILTASRDWFVAYNRPPIRIRHQLISFGLHSTCLRCRPLDAFNQWSAPIQRIQFA